ncbi:MAG TPA: hypothetical protein VGO59_02225 [Verrucomicrobiae bacterium]|jgi:hypothetical protein
MKRALTQFKPAAAILALAAMLLPCAPARAQMPLSNVVFTVGTTIRDASNHDWSFVLFGSPEAGLLSGKRFAIYGKPGAASNSAPFTLRGTAFQQTNVNTINSLLQNSVSLGQNLASLQNGLIRMLGNRFPGASGQTAAQNVVTAFQFAAADMNVAQSLQLSGGGNPGLNLCLGRAFGEQITGVTTYEVRELNPVTGAAGNPIGRVTITPGAPVVLPAPGAAFQVVTNNFQDDLRIRVRWGQPDALLRLSLLSYGFDVWRIARAPAESAGYNVTPPTPSQITSDAHFVLANIGPVMAPKYFPAAAANDPADGTTYFFSDGVTEGRNIFVDGEQFYYFITARDVLGRAGLASPGVLMQACRKIPPSPPAGAQVRNIIQLTNQERLMLTWQQNTNVSDQVSEYWIYRWPNPAMALSNDFSPMLNRAGVVPQVPAAGANSFVDNGAGAPIVPGVTNYWYSVRAVSQSACGPLLSAPTSPAWGVLRERFGPPAATGTVFGSCGAPAVMFQALNNNINAGGLDSSNWDYRFTCGRRDPGIAWVQYFVTNQFGAPDIIGPLYFPPGEDAAQFDYSLPVTGTNYILNVTCVAGNYYSQSSTPVQFMFTSPTASGMRQEAVFYAGNLFSTDIQASDPLLAAYDGGPPHFFTAESATAHPSGTVSMQYPFGTPGDVLIQVFTNSSWHDVGIYQPDSNGLYWISYPACLLGPLPQFQGAMVYLGPGNCNEHFARGADGGPVAPIHVQFGLTPGTKEYRVYRSLDGGPLSMFAQGEAAFDPLNPNAQVVRTDDSMPPSFTRMGYFVQLLDRQGHGSPMSLMGFRLIKPPKPPRPVLSQPLATGDANNPQVALSWFCPPAGVNRFGIKIARNDQPGSGKSTGIFSSKLAHLSTYNTGSTYLGLFSQKLKTIRFDEEQWTPPISTNFGPGPAFTMNVSLTPNVPYTFSVAAVDSQGGEGDPSQVWNFTWVPPAAPELVPWPARPPAAITVFDDPTNTSPRVAAVLLETGNVLDATYPVGIRIGNVLPLADFEFSTTVGTTNFFDYGGFAALPDPSQLIFRRRSSDSEKNGDYLLPIVVYRQQVTNALYPRVSGHLTQVTPLIEKIPSITFPKRFPTRFIPDLLIGCGQEPPPPSNPSLPALNCTFIYLRDQQPVVLGAAYQYYVVRLNSQHEVSEVIDAGQVQVPTSQQ